MQTERTRFLPKALTVELRRLPLRLLGLALVAGGAACWLALLSWSYADPSPNYATVSQPQNWLGHRGARLADSLMLSFGLASTFLVLPIFALGLQIAAGFPPVRPRTRLLFWLAATVAAPAFFSSFPTPARWMLNTGLGGVVGDFAAGRAAKLASVIPQLLLWPGFALLCLSLSIWFLWRACGLSLRDMSLALYPESAYEANASSREDPFEPFVPKERLVNKATSWTKRLSPRNRALVPREDRRDFWLTPARAKPSRTPAKAENPGKREIKPAEGRRTSNPSPFANWGSRHSEAGDSKESPEFQESGEDLFDDVRIEPFFGPQTRASSPRSSEDEDGPNSDTVSPFRRLIGRAGATDNREHRRSFERITNAVKGRKPLIYRKSPAGGEQSSDFAAPLPPFSLLAPQPHPWRGPRPDDPALMHRAAELKTALGDFGINGRITGIYPGPVITLFELQPGRGTKSSRVIGLADDIARSMGAPSARVAVIPGRDAIGIELPNPRGETASLREILESPVFQDSQAALPLALGKSIGGEPIVVDLARMPNLLIAGTAASGKSVAIHTMILSLLFRLPPTQCNFIMIDPKMLELPVYDGIPHLLGPVVTDPQKAVSALKWVLNEMNTRHEGMIQLGVRNITGYNERIAAAQLRRKPARRLVQAGFDPRTGEPIEEEQVFDPHSMPYIVVIIDEIADLIAAAGKDIEFAVQRLCKMGRAAGIHLIAATQRPSPEIMNGIKASFPSRIGFQVNSKIESRAIIGEQGAEQLLGAGDMLYTAAAGRIVRAHAPLVSDEDVEAVALYLKAQGSPAYRDDVLHDDRLEDEHYSNGHGNGEHDLYERAIEIVLRDRKPTGIYLQRRLGIGYSRAASLIERMEQEGIVGALGRSGRRDILLDAGQ